MIINAINMKPPPLGRLVYCREAACHLAYITNVQVVKFYLFFFFKPVIQFCISRNLTLGPPIF